MSNSCSTKNDHRRTQKEKKKKKEKRKKRDDAKNYIEKRINSNIKISQMGN